MNKLFLYLVGIGVLILVMVIAWEIIQINSGVNSNVNQAVIRLQRDTIFSEKLDNFLENKSNFQSGLPRAN